VSATSKLPPAPRLTDRVLRGLQLTQLPWIARAISGDSEPDELAELDQHEIEDARVAAQWVASTIQHRKALQRLRDSREPLNTPQPQA
jgi:hypothetical protein